MQAIITKYICATNTKGARIKASCEAGSITIDYPYELSGQAVHRKAAQALADNLGWNKASHGELLGGGYAKGYVFVFNNDCARG